MRITRYVRACSAAICAGIGARLLSRKRQPRPPARGFHPGWHRVALASLDFETTGVDPLTDRVVSYALLDDRGGQISGLIDPGVPIPPSAAEVHGLTVETLAGAPSTEVGLIEVIEWVQDLIDRQVGLVVFNAAYDLTMLRAEAIRVGLAQPDWERLLVVDPFVIGWGIARGKRASRKLTDVAAYYGVSLDNAHDAVADARAARDVAYEIGLRHPAVAVNSLPDLMQRQREWFALRAEDWNSYARRVGRSLDDPHGWPLARTVLH